MGVSGPFGAHSLERRLTTATCRELVVPVETSDSNAAESHPLVRTPFALSRSPPDTSSSRIYAQTLTVAALVAASAVEAYSRSTATPEPVSAGQRRQLSF